ncbi:MAG: HEAT repeat domain-containing protein [Tumebacillaceae bacterium]
MQLDTTVKELLQVLRTDDNEIYNDAVSTLASLGPKTIPVLVGGLEATDARIRSAIAHLLVQYGEQSIAALQGALYSFSKKGRLAASLTLASIGGSAIRVLCDALKNESVRSEAIQGLKLAQFPPEEVHTLVEIFQGVDEDASSISSGILFDFGNVVLPLLHNALTDADERVRGWAAVTILKINRDFTSITSQLHHSLLTGSNTLQYHIAWVLSQMKGTQVPESLIVALKKIAIDGEHAVQNMSSIALENIGIDFA